MPPLKKGGGLAKSEVGGFNINNNSYPYVRLLLHPQPSSNLWRRHRSGDIHVYTLRRLRSWPWNFIPLRPKQSMPQQNDEFRRTLLGWQRNLASAWRRRIIRCLSPRLFSHYARILYSNNPHAFGINFSRRCL